MIIFYQVGASIADLYRNPDAVIIAICLLVFILTFTTLTRVPLFYRNRKIAMVVTLVVTLITFRYLFTLNVGFQLLAVFLFIAIVGIFFRFFARRFFPNHYRRR